MKTSSCFARVICSFALSGITAAASAAIDAQPFEYAKGSLNEQEDKPDTLRTGKVVLCLAGDSTVTYSQGYGAGFRSHLDKQLQVINRSRGGRTTVSFRKDGRWDDILKIKPDYVMIQFGHKNGALWDRKHACNFIT